MANSFLHTSQVLAIMCVYVCINKQMHFFFCFNFQEKIVAVSIPPNMEKTRKKMQNVIELAINGNNNLIFWYPTQLVSLNVFLNLIFVKEYFVM